MAEPRRPDLVQAALQPLAELAHQMSDAARALAGGTGLDVEALGRWVEQLGAFPRLSVEALRGLVEEQRGMAERMAQWAEQHRELAEKLAASAERLRQLSEESAAIVEPLLHYAERISEAGEAWLHALRPGGRH
jgi:methyl-accepting chemotaxis protein